MPQYQGCIKLLKCQMKQAAVNIVMRNKQYIMIKVSRSININLFISQINSLSIDLKHKAQQTYITVQLKNDYSENKSSHKLLTRESIDALWVKSDVIHLSLKQSHIQPTTISQIMKKLKNVLKSGGKLAMKAITDHGDINPLCRTRNHNYKA